jgi:hypothetical protein
VYFVKGRSAARRGLAAEWLCARLAEQFELPIAPYKLATVPDELIQANPTFLADLGEGDVFASRRVQAVEFTVQHCELVPDKLRRDVLAFDWWIHHGDRMLTGQGGNPNLLWEPAANPGLVVIDHNLAFDPSFSAADFSRFHVFADDIPLMFSDFLVTKEYERRFSAALGIWDEACKSLPASWSFVDPERTVRTENFVADFRQILDRLGTPGFWQLPV